MLILIPMSHSFPARLSSWCIYMFRKGSSGSRQIGCWVPTVSACSPSLPHILGTASELSLERNSPTFSQRSLRGIGTGPRPLAVEGWAKDTCSWVFYNREAPLFSILGLLVTTFLPRSQRKLTQKGVKSGEPGDHTWTLDLVVSNGRAFLPFPMTWANNISFFPSL